MSKLADTKIMTSIKLPAKTEQSLLEHVISQKYGMRGKSRWIVEAIESFLQLPNYYELVNIASELDQLNKVVSIRISSELMHQLERALIEVRIHYPELEGVKSNIIRASIMQRLLRDSSVTDE